MKKNVPAWLVAFSIMLTGCNTIKSSLHYTQGTMALERNDLGEAIYHLEEAVRLHPDLCRNHTNLAAAYGANGELEKAWVHARWNANHLDQIDDICAIQQFRQIFTAMDKKYQIRVSQPSPGRLSEILGEPDDVVQGEGNTLWYRYGFCAFGYVDETMVGLQYLTIPNSGDKIQFAP